MPAHEIICEYNPQLNFCDQNPCIAKQYAKDEVRIYLGYEIPKVVHPLTLKVLRNLHKQGIVWVGHDDGYGLLARGELREIADAIGLEFIEDRYAFVLIDCNKTEQISI